MVVDDANTATAPAVIKVTKLQALKIATAVQADALLGMKSPEWMIAIAQLVDPTKADAGAKSTRAFEVHEVISAVPTPLTKLPSSPSHPSLAHLDPESGPRVA